jgi:hypothetical protein
LRAPAVGLTADCHALLVDQFKNHVYVMVPGRCEGVLPRYAALARTVDYRNTFGINNTTILLEKRGGT